MSNELWFIANYQRPVGGSIYHDSVQKILAKYYDNSELQTLTYDHNNKPTINSNKGYFSIAHSHELLAIIFSPYPIGIDLELITDKNHQKIAKKYFSEIEQKQIDFYYSWTAKEALIKLLGGRLFSLLPHISLQKNNDSYTASVNNNNYSVFFVNKDQFLVAICQNENNILPLKIFEL